MRNFEMVEPNKIKKCAVRISRINNTTIDVVGIQTSITDQRVRRCLVRLPRVKDQGSQVLLDNGGQMRKCYIRVQRIAVRDDKSSISSHDGIKNY